MNIWDLLKETPDERRKRKMLEARKPKRAPKQTQHPDDHYGFDGLNAYSKRKRQGKH
jgi:hypothetical protein